MFEHLINFDPEVQTASPKDTLATEKVSPAAALDAKINTNDWLTRMGAVDLDAITEPLDTKAARAAFANLVSASPEEITHTALANIKTPAAVQHLVGMLTAYDWGLIALPYPPMPSGHQRRAFRGRLLHVLRVPVPRLNAGLGCLQ